MKLRPVVVFFLALMLAGATPPAMRARQATPAVGSGATPAADVTIDLPAIVLTPRDLEALGLPGFGVLGLRSNTSLEQAAEEFAVGRGEPGPERLARVTRILQETGWRAGYTVTMGSPRRDDPNEQSAVVLAAVDVHGGSEGASQALAAFTDPAMLTEGDAEEIALRKTVGDEARLLRVQGRNETTGQAYDALLLSIREGNLGLGVALFDLSGQAPDQATVEALGARLLERSRKQAPGLSSRTLRLTGDGVTLAYERYAYLDGESVLTYGAAVAAATAATPVSTLDEATPVGSPTRFPIAPNVYRAHQSIGDLGGASVPDFDVQLGRFSDPSEASAGLAGYRAELDDYPSFDGFALVAAPAGDESFTVLWTARLEGVTLRGYGSYVRVGSEVATIYVTAPGNAPPLAVIEDLTRAQVECLRTTGACAALPAPPALIPGAELPNATPVASPASTEAGTPVEGSAVLPPGATFLGQDPGEWTASFLAWSLVNSEAHVDCAQGQGGEVWYLPGLPTNAPEQVGRIACEVPAGTVALVPILVGVDISAEECEAGLSHYLEANGGLGSYRLTIDGEEVSGLDRFRVRPTPLLSIAGTPTAGDAPLACGWVALLEPMPGEHLVRLTLTPVDIVVVDLEWRLRVEPEREA